MASAILAKFGTETAITATGLASLASSTSGAGYQLAPVDNSTNRFQKIHVFCSIMSSGTVNSTAGKGIYAYLLKAEKVASPAIVTDGASATTAGALTIVSAQQVGRSGPSVTTQSTAYKFDFVIYNPGPLWGLAFTHDLGTGLHATGSNHVVYYVGENPEAQ